MKGETNRTEIEKETHGCLFALEKKIDGTKVQDVQRTGVGRQTPDTSWATNRNRKINHRQRMTLQINLLKNSAAINDFSLSSWCKLMYD
jgi:hypothetical protein